MILKTNAKKSKQYFWQYMNMNNSILLLYTYLIESNRDGFDTTVEFRQYNKK